MMRRYFWDYVVIWTGLAMLTSAIFPIRTYSNSKATGIFLLALALAGVITFALRWVDWPKSKYPAPKVRKRG